MGSAIYLFPYLAKGVEVNLKPAADKATEKFNGEFGITYLRNWYNELLKTQEEAGLPGSSEQLILPLPYGFTRDPSDEGDRKDIRLSWINRYGQLAYGYRVPAVAVAINGQRKYSHFTLDEVESIRFTDNEAFTPYIEWGYDEQRATLVEKLVEKPDSIDHYLRFRGFRRISYQDLESSKDQLPFSQLDPVEWRVVREMEIPEDRNLWRKGIGNVMLELGYFTGARFCERMLHRIENAPRNWPNWIAKSGEEMVASLFANSLFIPDYNQFANPVMLTPRMDQFKGDEIIRELAAVPVARSF